MVKPSLVLVWYRMRLPSKSKSNLKYAGYIERQAKEIERHENYENLKLPADFDYLSIQALSIEVRQKLDKQKPETLGQASRISGVTPAAISLLLVHLKKRGHHPSKRKLSMIVSRETLSASLSAGIQELGLAINAAQLNQLLDYLALLQKWNKVYNLTAVRDPQQMISQHLLDSLAAVPAFATARNVLDVGAGGGLPGMVLAIARPDLSVAMIEYSS